MSVVIQTDTMKHFPFARNLGSDYKPKTLIFFMAQQSNTVTLDSEILLLSQMTINILKKIKNNSK